MTPDEFSASLERFARNERRGSDLFDEPEIEAEPVATDARSVVERMLSELPASLLREDTRPRLPDGTVLTREIEDLVLGSLEHWPTADNMPADDIDEAMMARFMGSKKPAGDITDADLLYDQEPEPDPLQHESLIDRLAAQLERNQK